MAKKQKVQKFGYALRVKMLDDKGIMSWRRVGFNFLTRAEALAYKAHHYPTCDKYTLMGIRLNIVPLAPPSRYDQEKAV